MSERQPLVGTVILNYRSTDDTLACLATVLASSELDQHVVVADNTEDVDEQAALRAQLPPNVEYLPFSDNVGYAAGNNAAIARLLELGVRYLWVLNPDVRVEVDTLRRMLATLRGRLDIGILGPRLTDGADSADGADGATGARIMSDGGRVDRERYGRTYHDNSNRPADKTAAALARVDYVTGACLLVDARVIATIGFIPEEFFLYFEETDFCRRAIEYGWVPSVDRGIVVAHYRRSSGWLPSAHYLYYMVRNRALFTARLGIGAELDPPLDADTVVRRAYDDMHETFIDPWRGRVVEREPSWVPVFDRIIATAKRDGHAGLTGRVDLDRIVAEPTAAAADPGPVTA